MVDSRASLASKASEDALNNDRTDDRTELDSIVNHNFKTRGVRLSMNK